MAYDFNGSSQYLISDALTAPTTTPLTLHVKVKTDTQPSGTAFLIVAQSSANIGSVIGTVNTNEFRAGTFNVATYFSSDTLVLNFSNSTWYSISGVFTSATSRRLYYNETANTESTNSVSVSSLARITIGAAKIGAGAASEYTDGQICDAAVWDAALTAAEIASLAKGFKANRIRPQSLKFYAPLIRSSVDLARGISVTEAGSPTVAAHPRVY